MPPPFIGDTADADANIVKSVFTCIVKKIYKHKTIILKGRRREKKVHQSDASNRRNATRYCFLYNIILLFWNK